MNIHGLQKMTLLDFPEKVACTVFCAGCNFRCPFCHNPSLVTRIQESNRIPVEEVFSFLRKRAGILDGVCVSGGEPFVEHDLEMFLGKIRELGFLIKVDTNGSDPERLKRIVDRGLVDYVAMDIKNSPGKYGITIGIEGYDIEKIRESVSFLLSSPVEYEFRTTVVKEFHKKQDFEEIGEWIRGAEKYFLQSFVHPGDIVGDGCSGYSGEVMEQAIAIVRKYVPNAKIRGK